MAEHVLTDVDRGIWLDQFDWKSGGASIRKRTLRGGLSDGVDVVEINNGLVSLSILPTRGLGIWCGSMIGPWGIPIRLGWRAPIRGPVHPKFVNVAERGGLGWLTGFDEWLCRCGLNWNGPPGDDNGRPLTLHGRIANCPAHYVKVTIGENPSRINFYGEVEESGLFYSRLRLQSYITLLHDSSRIDIRDKVTNLGGTPAEMQLLYHVNQGMLFGGSKVHVPVREMWPMTQHAANGLESWQKYEPPTPGFAEQVYCMYPAANASGRTLAVMHDAGCYGGMALRWSVAELPCFTVWKNTAATEDGCVTGLEPATNFPRFKASEREAGRVRVLQPSETWSAHWSIEITTSRQAIESWVRNVESIQSTVAPIIHREPLS